MLKYFLLALCLFPLTVHAEDELPPELQSFVGFSDILPTDEFGQSRGTKRVAPLQEIIPLIKKSIPEMAAYNLMNAEQVFCYHVNKRPKDYTGYTIDGMAVTGFCGELDASKRATAYEALFTHNKNILTTLANCHISPKLILRFVRGVDYTDVLLSSPCHSFTVFYGGKYQAFNIRQEIIDEIIKKLESVNEPFNSPALLKQTVANAVATTTEEEEILSKKQKENSPVMKWKEEEQKEEETNAEENKPTGGWGVKSWRQK